MRMFSTSLIWALEYHTLIFFLNGTLVKYKVYTFFSLVA